MNPLTGTNVQQFSVTTKKGHTVQFFFNVETDLLVVDLIHWNEEGGTEIVRKTLDSQALLKHVSQKKKVSKKEWLG